MQTVLFFLFSILCSACAYGNVQQTIAINTYKVYGADPWDPESIKRGITGSEEAVIYISQKLSQLGCKVVVFGDPPSGSPHSSAEANPRYVSTDFNDGTKFDVAVSWRRPDLGGELKKIASKVYLWPHDTYHWHLTDEQINAFDDVLWLSQWQREQWISVNPGFAKFTKIFGNGLNPEQFKPIQERENPYSCIYSSNFARGLEILLDIWPLIKLEFPRAKLDIYYGWQHWGLLSPEKEAKMRAQVNQFASMGVCNHGMVGHEELNMAYEQASLWTYPCIAPETFCITGIRAQLAGCVPVIIDGTGLKETVRYGYKCSRPDEYLATLLQAMREAEKITLDDRKKMGGFVRDEYTWEVMAKKWKQLFDANSNQDLLRGAVPIPTPAAAFLIKNDDFLASDRL